MYILVSRSTHKSRQCGLIVTSFVTSCQVPYHPLCRLNEITSIILTEHPKRYHFSFQRNLAVTGVTVVCVRAGATEVGDRGRRRVWQNMSADRLQPRRVPGGLCADRFRDVRR